MHAQEKLMCRVNKGITEKVSHKLKQNQKYLPEC